MANFKRKQSTVQAVQFVDGRYGEAIDFCPQLDVSFSFDADEKASAVASRSISGARVGRWSVNPGDWLVKDADDSFRLMTNEAFRAEFDPA